MYIIRCIVLIAYLGLGFTSQSPLNAQTVDTVCAGATGERYWVQNNTGSVYNWKVSGGIIANGQGTHEIRVDWNSDTGMFPIEIWETSQDGCPGDTVRAWVLIKNGIDIEIKGPSKICLGEEITLTASGADFYKWNTGSQNNRITIRPKETNTYSVIGSSPLCGTDTASFNIEVVPPPSASFNINPTDPVLNQYVDLIYNGNTKGIVLEWQFNADPIGYEKSISYFISEPGDHEFKLVVTDSNGCADTANKYILIDPPVHVYIPNAFTPNNGDGLNQTFAPSFADIEKATLRIYNRWGEKIYEQTDAKPEWDGYYKGNLAMEGVYVYYIDVIGANGRFYTYNGTVTMIK